MKFDRFVGAITWTSYYRLGKENYAEDRKEEKNGRLYTLDFDGVTCDSCGESSISGVKPRCRFSPSVCLLRKCKKTTEKSQEKFLTFFSRLIGFKVFTFIVFYFWVINTDHIYVNVETRKVKN